MNRLKIAALVGTLPLILAACSAPGSEDGTGGAGEVSSAAQAAAEELGIDLSKCPTDITAPIEGTLKVGSAGALTGPAAVGLAPVIAGQKAAVEYFNNEVDLPIKFEFEVRDDEFQPDKTLAATRELIQADGVDVLNSIVGTAQVAAAASAANQYCVPMIAGNAGGRSVNTPKETPFTTIWVLPSYVDAKSWVSYLDDEFPEGAKVALYTGNTESGKDYREALESLMADSAHEIVSETTIEAADTLAPATQVSTMKASGANVLMAAPSPNGQCAGIASEVANQGWKPDVFFLTSMCSPSALISPAGDAAEGLLANLYLNDPEVAGAEDDAELQKIVDLIKEYQPKQTVNASAVSGFTQFEVLVKAVEAAADSELGLSRLGLLYAARNMSYQSAGMLPGVTYDTSWPEDVVSMESTQLSRWGAKDKSWTKITLFDFNGETTGLASVN